MIERIAEIKESALTRVKNKILQARELTMIVFLVVFGLIIFIVNKDFLTVLNLMNVLRGSVFYFIVGCGATYVIISGELDLSVGSILAFSGLIVALSLVNGVPVPIAIISAICASMIIGYINGILVTRLKIPSLVVTLGMLYSVRGIIMIITKGKTISNLPSSFKVIGQGEIFKIPNLIIFAFVLGIIMHVVLTYTRFGYNIKSVGGNKIAAEAAGIDIKMVKTVTYVISGFCCGLAGILMTSRVSVGSPSIGMGYELYVISAVIIGGTSLFGGIGTVTGTLLGAIFLSILQNGMLLMHISPYWQSFIIGIVMITAVGIDQFRRGKMWQISG